MAYKALYRTYRPQTFDEVAGQEHIVKTLKNALATGKIAHRNYSLKRLTVKKELDINVTLVKTVFLLWKVTTPMY